MQFIITLTVYFFSSSSFVDLFQWFWLKLGQCVNIMCILNFGNLNLIIKCLRELYIQLITVSIWKKYHHIWFNKFNFYDSCVCALFMFWFGQAFYFSKSKSIIENSMKRKKMRQLQFLRLFTCPIAFNLNGRLEKEKIEFFSLRAKWISFNGFI